MNTASLYFNYIKRKFYESLNFNRKYYTIVRFSLITCQLSLLMRALFMFGYLKLLFLAPKYA